MVRARSFENSSERRVRRVLSLAVEGTHYWVNSHTPIESVLEADDGDTADERSMIRNGHFDFTIHRQSAATPLWAVEYDGPEHDKPEQVRRDIVKNRICGKANLSLLRIGYREDDDFLTAVERLTALEWLVRRWIIYEKSIDGLTQRSEQWVASLTSEQLGGITFEELSPEFHFELENTYPPLRAIADRLLDRFGIEVDLLHTTPDTPTGADVRWRAVNPWFVPLPDIDVDGFLSGYECEVEVFRAGDPSAGVVFTAHSTYAARWTYPVYGGQSDAFDLKGRVPVFCGPPWAGSPARIGGEIAWYRALKKVERWAEASLLT